MLLVSGLRCCCWLRFFSYSCKIFSLGAYPLFFFVLLFAFPKENRDTSLFKSITFHNAIFLVYGLIWLIVCYVCIAVIPNHHWCQISKCHRAHKDSYLEGCNKCTLRAPCDRFAHNIITPGHRAHSTVLYNSLIASFYYIRY